MDPQDWKWLEELFGQRDEDVAQAATEQPAEQERPELAEFFGWDNIPPEELGQFRPLLFGGLLGCGLCDIFVALTEKLFQPFPILWVHGFPSAFDPRSSSVSPAISR